MEFALIKDILIIFGLSIGVLLLFYRLHLPASVGFLITGILAGPFGLGLIRAIHEVEIFAEIGVILLLFTIGIEFSLENLSRLKKSVLLGGALQVLATVLVVFLIARQVGLSSESSLFAGFLISLSSTAIVLKILQERAEVTTPHGQVCLSLLIFQDIIVIPRMLLTPLLAGSFTNGTGNMWFILPLKALGIILFVNTHGYINSF